MEARSPPGGPRSGPRGAKTTPRGAKRTPRAPQEPPKRRKKGANKVTIFCGALGVASGRPPGAILARFWSLPGTILEPFSKLFEASWAGKPGEKLEANARNAPSSPAQAAQRPSKGIERSTPLAILMLALLSPRLLCCSSWPRALVSLVVLAFLLVCCVACNACGSRVERASRSMIARFNRFAHSACPGA